MRKDLQCKIYPFGTNDRLTFVVVCSFYGKKILLSKHKVRNTWETQGGHIEHGETPLEAAKRELYEEAGVSKAVLIPVCDYLGYDDRGSAYGTVYLAKVEFIGELPESEMEMTGLFDELPDNLTYPNVTPVLFEIARRQLGDMKCNL